MQDIYIVSHCVLNTASKTAHEQDDAYRAEEAARRAFVMRALQDGAQLLQLPCPELALYGAARWGHARAQFDTPFYRAAAREMLAPLVLQIEEYVRHPSRFRVRCVVGIDGSPSCGVTASFDGDGWGGEFSGGEGLARRLATGHLAPRPGVFMEVLGELLRERGLELPFVPLWEVTSDAPRD